MKRWKLVAFVAVFVAVTAISCASTTEFVDEANSDSPVSGDAITSARTKVDESHGEDKVLGRVIARQPASVPTVSPATASEKRFDDPATDEPWYALDQLGEPYSEAVNGVLTFRGSPNRSYLGKGPVPKEPTKQWRYPARPMCSISTDGNGPQAWCGTGWTGQPAIWERDGETWIAFGAYDGAVHVLNANTGEPRMPPFQTGDIIKGSLTVDPDGHPLLYVGSRDNLLRVLSWDTGELVELWSLDARSVTPQLWNDDWDGSPAILDDHLIIGGENSNLHVIRLNRAYERGGQISVAPELLAVVPGWDDELRSRVGDNVSIEGSVTVVDDVVWFANSGGLVQAWDLQPVRSGQQPDRMFAYWVGDDVDATIVVDEAGFVYAAVEFERNTDRSRTLGQVIKLDPRRPVDPVVWSVQAREGLGTGVWATPAVTPTLIVVPTAGGDVLGIDRDDGTVRWTLELPGPLWSSPLIVDNILIQADCGGTVSAFDLASDDAPTLAWAVDLGGCIESTPTLWEGRLWVGTRGGFMHMIGDGS